MSDAISPELASLSLTHIYYNPHSHLSLISAYLSLVPQALLLFATATFYATREAEIALYIIGQLLCEGVNMILKRTIAQPRPSADLGDGYGMPSSHAQFMGFVAAYSGACILCRGVGRLGGLGKAGYAGGLWTLSAAVVVSRVVLGYHSVEQVVVGSGVGLAVGGVWYAVTEFVRGWEKTWGVLGGRTLWGWGVEEVGGLVWLRDTMVGGDVVVDGYMRWREKRQLKQQ